MTTLALVALALAASGSPQRPAAATYFVRLVQGIADNEVGHTAHALARAYGGKVRLINLRGFQAEMPKESLQALIWDERVELVAEYPRVLEAAPSARFVGTASHGEREYRVRLADSGRRYDQARVLQIAMDLANQNQARVTGAYAPAVGRPWLLLMARPPMARALSQDPRVAWVAETGNPAAAVSPDVTLKPLPRGPKPPERVAKTTPEPARGTLRRASRHYKDRYFIVLDPTHTDVSSARVIEQTADEIAATARLTRMGSVVLRSPAGFYVAANEEQVTAAAADSRVKWVEEAGPYLRTPEPVAGAYQVVLRAEFSGVPGSGPQSVRQIAEDLAHVYGGRVDAKFIWVAPFGFVLEDASEDEARAMSEDPRVDLVEEEPVLRVSLPSPN